jgi:hypothetical protein
MGAHRAAGEDVSAAVAQEKPPSVSSHEEGLRRFIAELAERGGSGRCHWHRHVWPAERAGLIRTRYEPVRTPPVRNLPIREWCYRVTLTDAGWALARAAAANDNVSPSAEEIRS